jgi:hypothetical protein
MAPGVLKSSSIAALKAAARGSAQSMAGRSAHLTRRLQRGVQALERGARVFQQRVAEVERAAVVRAQHEEAHRLAVELLQHVGDGEEVAQALGHLLVVDVQEAVVHPGLHKGRAAGPFALRDLVLMVRELQVHAAAVDVEGSPSSAQLMAEHSMCQPGRPGP